jgi:cytochrome c55X
MSALTGLVSVMTAFPVTAADQPANPSRRAEIVNMVRQDCGSCHGMTLRGGLGPSLEARTLADKDTGQLQFVILNGRRGTPMPPWKDFLTDTEVGWVVDMLMQVTLEGTQHAR